MDHSAFGLGGPHPSPQLLESLAFQGKTSHEMDSYMVAIDKTRAGKAMDVLWWIITKLRVAHGDFSHGDKKSFWLAYELAHVPYAFSPWGVSVDSSWPNNGMVEHPDTLRGSIAQYLPVHTTGPGEVFCENGGGVAGPSHARDRQPPSWPPDHVQRQRNPRGPSLASHATSTVIYPLECLVGLGSTALPRHCRRLLFRRRVHYAAITLGGMAPLAICEFAWDEE